MNRCAAGISIGCLALLILGFSVGVSATETETPTKMSKTLVVIKLGSAEPVMVRSRFQEKPPVITIEFPGRHVIGSLPERSAVSKGVIQTVAASYDNKSLDTAGERFIRSVEIELSAVYTYKIRSEIGQVVVEIDHPASVGSASFEVGLRGGTIIEAMAKPTVTERFRAMQEALNRASPTSWTMQFGQKEAKSASVPTSVSWPAASVPAAARPTLSAAPIASPQPAGPRKHAVEPWMLALGLGVLTGLWLTLWSAVFSTSRFSPQARTPSSVALIDQLVWSAFERQGFRLMAEQAIARPLVGTLRIIEKEGNKWAFLFIGQNAFFEKER